MWPSRCSKIPDSSVAWTLVLGRQWCCVIQGCALRFSGGGVLRATEIYGLTY